MFEFVDKWKFYINGKWVDLVQFNDFDVLDFLIEEVVVVILLGGQVDMDVVVVVVKVVFLVWLIMLLVEWLVYVEKILVIYQCCVLDMVVVIISEMGVLQDMLLEDQVGVGFSYIQIFIDFFCDFEFICFLGVYVLIIMVVWELIGVVGLIMLWNWLMNQVMLKVILVILVGNMVVLKLFEIVLFFLVVWFEIVDEVGLFVGVYNMVNGDGLGVGMQFFMYFDVEMISFIGLICVGIVIIKVVVDIVKKVVLELGGKGVNFVFVDVDEKVVECGVWYVFYNLGQFCNVLMWMLVEWFFYDKVVEKVCQVVEEIVVVIGYQLGVYIGLVVSKV